MFQHFIEHLQGTCTTKNILRTRTFLEQHQDVATSVPTSTQKPEK